jgi:hypothetical protein
LAQQFGRGVAAQVWVEERAVSTCSLSVKPVLPMPRRATALALGKGWSG